MDKLKLYKIQYSRYTWNGDGTYHDFAVSYGMDEEDAVRNIKDRLEEYAGGMIFAEEVEIPGVEITVKRLQEGE